MFAGVIAPPLSAVGCRLPASSWIPTFFRYQVGDLSVPLRLKNVTDRDFVAIWNDAEVMQSIANSNLTCPVSAVQGTSAEPLVGAGSLDSQFEAFQRIVKLHPTMWEPSVCTKVEFAKGVNWVSPLCPFVLSPLLASKRPWSVHHRSA